MERQGQKMRAYRILSAIYDRGKASNEERRCLEDSPIFKGKDYGGKTLHQKRRYPDHFPIFNTDTKSPFSKVRTTKARLPTREDDT